MAVSASVFYIVEHTASLIRDKNYDSFSPEFIWDVLREHETEIAGEAVWWGDIRYQVFRPSSYIFNQVGFLATDAIFNEARDNDGTPVVIENPTDLQQFRTAAFRFAAEQTFNWFFVFGQAYNPYLAAADILENHSEVDSQANLKSLSVMQYSVSFGDAGSAVERLRKRGALLNRRRENNLVEGAPDFYDFAYHQRMF